MYNDSMNALHYDVIHGAKFSAWNVDIIAGPQITIDYPSSDVQGILSFDKFGHLPRSLFRQNY